MKKIALCQNLYALGITTINSEGVVTHDPLPGDIELLKKVYEASGHEIVELVPLVKGLIAKGIEPTSPKITSSSKPQFHSNLYQEQCMSLGKHIWNEVSGHENA